MLQIIILGIVQGIGEFLPISSSAHLILIPYLFNFDLTNIGSDKLAFDLALHFGTLSAVLFVFYKDWLNIFKGVIKFFFKGEQNQDNKMFWYLVYATIPGALVGFLFEDVIEETFRSSPLYIAIFLGVMGVLLYVVDKYATARYKIETSYEQLDFKKTFLIGISQAFAVIPGFSRSGTTILTGRLIGLSREAAAKFTFLLSVPIILGATILKIDDLVFTKEVLVGVLTSAIVGVITIKFLLKYIKNRGFAIFAYYRVILAIIIITKVILS